MVAAYLLATTAIGAKLAGRQATIRDFFLAGRKLPWWAIFGSIIATETSAVTFVALPTISFAVGGNLTYTQWAVGAPDRAPIYLAFNWSYPIGAIMTLALGYCLGKRAASERTA